jgi:hypothetical protein
MRVERSPQGLGPPCPPTCLEPTGVKPRTPDTVIRPFWSRPSRASQPSSPISSPKPGLVNAGNRRTAFAFSLPTLVVRIFRPNQVPASFGLGTSRDVAPCSAPPEKHPSIRSSDVCFPNSRLRLPVLAGSRCRPRGLRLARCSGLWDPPHNRGRGCARTPVSPLRRVPFTSLGGLVTVSGMLSEPTRPMGPTSDTPVASPAPVFVGPPFTPSRGSSRAGAAKIVSTAAA